MTEAWEQGQCGGESGCQLRPLPVDVSARDRRVGTELGYGAAISSAPRMRTPVIFKLPSFQVKLPV